MPGVFMGISDLEWRSLPETLVLEVEDGHHEDQEGDGRPVGQEGDGALGPGWKYQCDDIHHWSPGVPHTALVHRQEGEHCSNGSHNNYRLP